MNRINKKQRPRSTLTERKSGGAANIVDGGVGVTINRSGAKIIIIKIQHKNPHTERAARRPASVPSFGRFCLDGAQPQIGAHGVLLTEYL